MAVGNQEFNAWRVLRSLEQTDKQTVMTMMEVVRVCECVCVSVCASECVFVCECVCVCVCGLYLFYFYSPPPPPPTTATNVLTKLVPVIDP